MNDAFDDLERQLRRAVKQSKDSRTFPWRGWKRLSALALAAALLVSGVTLAAARLTTSTDSPELQGRKIAVKAVEDTAHAPACRHDNSAGLSISGEPVLPEITTALPALGAPASLQSRDKALDWLRRRASITGLSVVAATPRLIPVTGGLSLLVYVQPRKGSGPFALADPAGCVQLRRRRVAELSDNRSASVKKWAYERLAQWPDSVPGQQVLWTLIGQSNRRSGFGGAGTPIQPGRKLRLGLLALTTPATGRRSVYVGIAGPRTTHIVVRATRPVSGTPRQVPVRQGFYVVDLPHGTGRTRLLEVTSDGVVVRQLKVR